MSEGIKLTEEDFAIMRGKSAMAAFTSAVALCFLRAAELPDGKAVQDFLLKELQQNLKSASAPNAPFPMPEKERKSLRQYYRLFLGFYRDPNLPQNLPNDSTKH